MDKKKTEDIFCFLNAIIFGIFWRPLTTREDKLLKSIVINYLQEAHLGELVDIYLAEKDGYIIGCGKVREDGRLSFTFKLSF